jgi:HEAT repeat protein
MRWAVILAMTSIAIPRLAIAEEPIEPPEQKLLAMIDQLRDDDRWSMRLEAAAYLGRTGDIRVRKPLIRALADTHYGVRAAAIRALTKLQDPRAIKDLIDRFGDDEPFVASEARQSVELFDVDVARPYLVRALKRHIDPRVRLGAAELLAADGDSSATRALLEAIGDEDEVGKFAVETIRQMPRERAIALFLIALQQEDYGVQVAAIRALVELDTALAADPLIDLLASEVPEVTIAATQGLRTLAKHVDKNKWLVLAKRAGSRFERARALKVLGVIGGEEAANLLLAALDDPDVLVRGAAVNGIASLGDLRAIEKLTEMKKNEDNGRIISLVRTTLLNLRRLREKGKSEG